MQTPSIVKHKVWRTLEQLPPQGIEELSHFLDFLSFKYQQEHPVKVLTLGGRWQHIAFDVTDEEVRALRQQVSGDLLSGEDGDGVSG